MFVYLEFPSRIAAEYWALSGYVREEREEREEYLRDVVLDRGFLRVVCEHCHAARLLGFSCKKRWFCPS